MVAGTYNYLFIAAWRPDFFYSIFGCGTLYLYAILASTLGKKGEA